jgi:hypothetical protein
VTGRPDSWFSKVLIFNKLIRGTAPQLAYVLATVLEGLLAKGEVRAFP